MYVTECPLHDHCLVVAEDDYPERPGSFASHASADIDPAIRLNDTCPMIEDRRKGAPVGATVERRQPDRRDLLISR